MQLSDRYAYYKKPLIFIIIIIYIRLPEAKIYQRIERCVSKSSQMAGILTLARASHAAIDATLTMLGKLDLRVLMPRRLKCALLLHNAQCRVIY